MEIEMEIHELIPEGPWDDESGPKGAMTEEEKQEYRLDQQDEEERSSTMEQWANGWAEKLNPKAIEEHGAAIRQHGHTTQSIEVETIDLTPVRCQTPEGNARVNAAMKAFEEAREDVARLATMLYKDGCFDDSSVFDELRAAIEERFEAENAFLRAVAGR